MLAGQTLVHLQEGNHALYVPKVRDRAPSVDVSIHGVFEKDRAEDLITLEAGTCDDPTAHGVHEVEHLVVVRVLILVDPIGLQGAWGTSTALIQGGNETPPRSDLLELIIVHIAPWRAERSGMSTKHGLITFDQFGRVRPGGRFDALEF